MNSIPRIMSEQISQDLFVLSSNGKYVCFAPFRQKAFIIKSLEGVNVLRNYFHNQDKSPDLFYFLTSNKLLEDVKLPRYKMMSPTYHPKNLILSLSSDCNLRCQYCYASAGEQHDSLTWDIIENAIRISINESKKFALKKFKLVFHGGGEALVRWDLLCRATSLVEQLWKGEKNFSIVTNATLIDSEKAMWLKNHDFRVSISLDGPKDVHDIQRPKADGSGSFDECIEGMSYLRKSHVPFGIRSTICQTNIDRIKEMLLIAKSFETGLKVEPLVVTGRAEHNMVSISFDDFYLAMLDAIEFSKRMNITISSTYYHELSAKTEFCSGNGEIFCILPEGLISTCTRVTRKDDELSDIFVIGDIDAVKYHIDSAKIEYLKKLNVENFAECKSCFAKWYCVGGCYHSRLTNGGKVLDEHCLLTKALLFYRLIERLESL